MAYFFEEEPDDWAEEQQTAQQQQQHAEDGPPEEYQPELWEIAGVDADAEHSGRLPTEYDPLAPNLRGGCRNCDSFTVDLRWREAFGVYLCASTPASRACLCSHHRMVRWCAESDCSTWRVIGRCHSCKREVELISKVRALLGGLPHRLRCCRVLRPDAVG